MKKIRQYFAIFLIVISITTGITTPSEALSGSDTVYITKTGKCYHKQTCRTIKKSKGVKKVTLEKALKQGLRECQVCEPGTLTKSNPTRSASHDDDSDDADDDETVFLTTPKKGFKLSKTVYVSTSGKIHKNSNCSGMKKYTKMTYEEACELGYEHCKKCFK